MYYTTFDNDNKVNIDNLNDIYNIKNPENIKNLNLSFYGLTHLDKHIFINLTNLRELSLSYNKLSHLDKDIFNNLNNLQILNLYNNNIPHLDKDIFNNLTNLRELFLSYNKLTHLDKQIFNNLTNLQILSLFNNNLTHLDKQIFYNLTNLQKLYLSYNKLTNLDKYIFNNITNLQELRLYNNSLTTLPSSITSCTNLHTIEYYNNEINYLPPNIQRFLNNLHQQSNNIQVYNDSQNVHNHSIQEGIKTSLENILNIPKTINKDKLINQLLEDNNINDRSKRLLLEYCNDLSIHSILNITFEEALLHILEYINLELAEYRNDILKVLEDEILDSECKCFTGRISRLVNCLNGFSPLVEVKIPDNMAISNIIVLARNNYNGDDIEELKTIIKNELLDRKYEDKIIKEYLEYIEL